jgi:hypothetical protein
LYGPLKGKCRQDDKYRWFPVFGTSQAKTSATDEPSLPDTPFARLCRYYLACLSQDEDAGISVFATNRYGDLDYHELDELPLSTGSGLFQSEGARRLLGRIHNQRLIELGWNVMRFWVYEIRDDVEGCISRIKHWAESPS